MSHIALVTGGTRGIGAAICKRLQEDGFRVAATYQKNAEQAEAFSTTTGIKVYQWDVRDLAACQAGVIKIEQELGEINVLVNNAGITMDGAFHKMSSPQWDEVISTNLTSCFNMCQVVLPGMRDREYGRIINISSINGQQGQFGQTNYAAAKAGILGFTKSLALETAAKHITVNAVAPGYVNTDMVAKVSADILTQIIAKIPVGRLGEPEDIAHAVSFLANEKTSFMTGATLTINGGQYLA